MLISYKQQATGFILSYFDAQTMKCCSLKRFTQIILGLPQHHKQLYIFLPKHGAMW